MKSKWKLAANYWNGNLTNVSYEIGSAVKAGITRKSRGKLLTKATSRLEGAHNARLVSKRAGDWIRDIFSSLQKECISLKEKTSWCSALALHGGHKIRTIRTIRTLTPSIHQDKIFSNRGFCTSNAQNKQSDLIMKSLGFKNCWIFGWFFFRQVRYCTFGRQTGQMGQTGKTGQTGQTQGGRCCTGARVAPAEKFGLGRKF